MKYKTMRRVWAFLLAAVLTISLLPAAAAAGEAGIIVTPDSLTIKAGESKTVSVALNDNVPTGTTITNISGTAPSGSNIETKDATVADNGQTATIKVAVAESAAKGKVPVTITVDANVPESSGGTEGSEEPGNSENTRTSERYTARIKVTVEPKENPPTNVAVTGVSLNKTTLDLKVGANETLTATVAPSNATNKEVTWSSNKQSVATVDENGKVTAVAKGTANITVRTADGDKTATCTVTVTEETGVPVTGISGIISSIPGGLLNKNKTLKLTPVIIPSNAANKEVTWTSSKPEVATVDESGLVTGVAPGEAYITAKTVDGGYEYEYPVIVSGLAMESTMNLFVNKTESLACQPYGSATSSIVWSSDNESIATVSSGRVTGLYPGKAIITAKAGNYTATCEVTVEEDIAEVIDRSIDAGKMLSFSDLMSELNSRCQTKTKSGLSYVMNLSVSPKQGTLFYRYVSPDLQNHGVGGTEKYYRSPGTNQWGLAEIFFVPNTTFSGTATIRYTGYGENGSAFTGTIQVKVASTGDVAYSTAKNRPLAFAVEDFQAICMGKTGRTFNYITFEQPNVSRGTLYYNYSTTGQYSQQVTPSTRYYSGSNPRLDQITFVPAEDFTGTVEIPYHCVDSSGSTYNGKVTIDVYSPDGTKDGTVHYDTRMNTNVTLSRGDFNDACESELDASLYYIRFDDIPRSSEGVLWYRYSSSSGRTRINDTNERYYYSSTKRIDDITFVPANNFTGTVTIPFTGYISGNRDSFKGTLVIEVGETNGSGTVTYRSTNGSEITFEAADFNKVSRDLTGENLDYIRFGDTPTSRQGDLYYRYNSKTGKYDSEVGTKSSERYYRSGSRNISDVTFVPNSSYSGTVSIPFSGWNTKGDQFNGTVSIEVGQSAVSSIRYSSYGGVAAVFRASDFRSAADGLLGRTLSYIRFTSLPSSSQGALYANYSSGVSANVSVRTGTDYYVSGSPGIDQIRFVPQSGYQGIVTIPYVGYDSNGDRCSGTIEITVANNQTPVIPPSTVFTDLTGYDWAAPAIEYLYDKGVVTGTSATQFSPRQQIRRGDFVLMICRAFNFNMNNTNSGFSDVPGNSYYAGAITAARNLGIAQGDGTNFLPNSNLTREDAMTMICRAMSASGKNVSSVSTGVLSAFSDGGQVSDYARTSVAALVQLGVVTGTSDQRLAPRNPISRAEMAVILQRVMQL